MRGSRNIFSGEGWVCVCVLGGGGGGVQARRPEKSLDNGVYFFYPQLTGGIHLRGPIFPRGSIFPGGGGGGSKEAHITYDPGRRGSGPPYLPSGSAHDQPAQSDQRLCYLLIKE